MKENIHQTTQIIAGVVAADNARRIQELQFSLSKQDQAFGEAIQQINGVRDFVSNPEHILGNSQTKHGEIAEQVEVGIRNARYLLDYRSAAATFEGVSRTASADYLIDGVPVQSKFINGIGSTLDHVLEHMRKYEGFGRDGSYYHIPKDQYETIQRISNGQSVEGLTQNSIHKIQEKIQAAEQLTGKPFEQIIKPGVSNYADVQQGRVHETLNNHARDLSDRNDELKQQIDQKYQPNLSGMAGAAAKGAVISAGLSITFKIYEKYQQGKNPFKGEFIVADWQELGIVAVKGGVTGGISGAALYGLTNFANLPAPFAGAVVGAGFAIASLSKRYAAGEITMDEFLDLGMITCAEAAIVGLGAAIGQALIPMPIIGAVIGTIASRMVFSLGKQQLHKESEKLKKRLEAYYSQSLATIDQVYHEVLTKIIAQYDKLGDLTSAAFDQALNTTLKLQASVELAEAYGVPQAKIIHNLDQLDAFMLS